jgi:ABC-type antimicrobial peptide transport system permease subunit
MAWYSYAQVPGAGAMNVELRTTGDPLAILPTVRKAVAQIDPNLPLEDPQTQQAVFEKSYFFNTLTAGLTTFFGLLAALLVAIGLYGTLAYRVGRRTQEIGVRMALGATRENVQWIVLRESLWMVALGVVAGLPLSLGAGKLMQSQLYKLSWHDPLAMVGALFTVLIVAALASWLPARRAASVDPMQALRSE